MNGKKEYTKWLKVLNSWDKDEGDNRPFAEIHLIGLKLEESGVNWVRSEPCPDCGKPNCAGNRKVSYLS